MKRLILLSILGIALAFAGCNKNPQEPSVYRITVTGSANGTATANMTEAAPGQTVTLTAIPDDGYELDSWTVSTGNTTLTNSHALETRFMMPAGDVAVSANFVAEDGRSMFRITVTSGEHGTASADVEEALKDAIVTLTAVPDEGYEFAGWTVESGNATLDYPTSLVTTFKMPEGDVELSTRFVRPADLDVYSLVRDEKFLAYLKSAGFDTDNNGRLSLAEAAEVIQMTVPYDSGISSLAGIERFVNIQNLTFAGNNVETIDLTPLSDLHYLNCNTNDITSIDLSQNTKLGHLICYDNLLAELDLSNNPELYKLRCYGNNLTSLDLSVNIKLEELDCSGNDIATLDLPATNAFWWLQCNGNNLTALDVDHCPGLKTIFCHNNQLGTLDVTQNTLLVDLSSSNCGLSTLDLTRNEELTQLSLGNNELTTLDLSGNSKLIRLSVGSNNFTSIDLSDVPMLENLHIDNNNLTSLDTSGNPALYLINCVNNQISSFTASENLSFLECSNNKLTSFDVARYPKLNTLECNGNQLTTLDASSLVVGDFDGYYWLFCGQQKTASGADHTLTLTLAQKHLSMWNTAQRGYEALKSYPENSGVTLAQ